MKVDAQCVTLRVWVETTDPEAAKRAVNRMVRQSYECTNNGDIDIVAVEPWDYDG